MKKITLSALAALAVSTVAYAETLTLYTDKATGQVFTTPGEGRVEMGDFIDAKTASKNKSVKTYAKASKLQFSGTHYLGYVYNDPETGDSTSNFETRRNYFQVKAYMFDDKKSYMRMTLDTFENKDELDGKDKDSWEVRLKYAFLYLDDVLPYTGIEMGQAHRPWIDYEEHYGMHYRSISKVFVEASEGAHLTNSADIGFNLKTKTPYFTSEVGMFNGEGYHSHEDGEGNSLEWRATAAFLGNGDKKRKPLKDSYFDASFFGQMQSDSNKNDNVDYTFYGLHAVYNQPEFLISAQYITSDTDEGGDTYIDGTYEFEGNGYSVNGTYRFGNELAWEVIGRYDAWTKEGPSGVADVDMEHYYAGIGYQYSKNVKFIANVLGEDPNKDVNDDGSTSYMFTAEVHW